MREIVGGWARVEKASSIASIRDYGRAPMAATKDERDSTPSVSGGVLLPPRPEHDDEGLVVAIPPLPAFEVRPRRTGAWPRGRPLLPSSIPPPMIMHAPARRSSSSSGRPRRARWPLAIAAIAAVGTIAFVVARRPAPSTRLVEERAPRAAVVEAPRTFLRAL
jgi:hypothetical protein